MSTMIRFARHPIRERFLQKVILASDVVLWLFWLPVIMRIHSIPGLLDRLTRIGRTQKKKTPVELREAVGIVTRICKLRLFGSRVFPRACLRQSLALYRTLRRMGYSVEIHFGIRKDGEDLQGHSWVTLGGKRVAERARIEIFKTVYSYPSASYRASSAETNRSLANFLFNRNKELET